MHPRVLSRLRKKNLHYWMRDYARHLVRRARTPQPTRPATPAVRALRSLRAAVGPRARRRRHARASTRGPSAIPRSASSATATAGRRATAGSSPARSTGPYFLDRLAELARAGFGEVEFHLHHDGDTARHARAAHRRAPARPSPSTATSRATASGFAWAFIHGNWSLANGRPDGKWCGVDDELVDAARARLLRRPDVPVGARSVSARQGQPDLLADRRPDEAPRATSTASARASAPATTIAC